MSQLWTEPKGLAAQAACGPMLRSRGGKVDVEDRVECKELPCRTVLNRPVSSRELPFEWTVNPYRGCEFGCRYCYARYTHEFLNLSTGRDFERRIYAKKNAAPVLARELGRRAVSGRIAIGSATDPYQPVERQLGVTRTLLEEFAKHRSLEISVTTKSDLVLRDIDVLQEIGRHNDVSVNVTITTLDAELARSLEPRAPTPLNRLRAVKELSRAGIAVAVLAAPILPFITDELEALRRLVSSVHDAGARDLWSQVLFLRSCSAPTFFDWLSENRPGLVPIYRRYFADAYAPRAVVHRITSLVRELKGACAFPGLERTHAPDEGAAAQPAVPACSTSFQLDLFA